MPDRSRSTSLTPLSWDRPGRPIVVGPDDPAALISLQERLVTGAVEAGASDLHVEPRADRVRVRLRIDGWLHDVDSLPRWLLAGLVSRFKVTAGMDVTERRRPQDGRATVGGADPPVDLRISTLPTRHGEKVVVRLLPRDRRPRSLRSLGLDDADHAVLRAFVEQPQGLILAAGPTGAGKTTTLYALLGRVDAVGRHVLTLEDPVEYSLPEIVQVPVRHRVGVDFATALRALLRQDPDVILVGEIRDEETARIAVRAAATGHLVLSSVHANSAVESAHRLLDLGVPGHLLGAALIGVISQRLARRICGSCRVADDPATRHLEILGIPPGGEPAAYWRGSGCDACHGGYAGRVGLFETLRLTRDLRRCLAADTDPAALEARAHRLGALRPLHRAVRAAVRSGLTTVAEAARLVRCPEGAGETDSPES